MRCQEKLDSGRGSKGESDLRRGEDADASGRSGGSSRTSASDSRCWTARSANKSAAGTQPYRENSTGSLIEKATNAAVALTSAAATIWSVADAASSVAAQPVLTTTNS